MEGGFCMKTYIRPSMTVVRLQHKWLLMQQSVITTNGNANIHRGGGGRGSARTKESGHGVGRRQW